WTSSIYVFYEELVVAIYNGRKAHMFKCRARGCTYSIPRYQDVKLKDRNLPSNLRTHSKSCWGESIVKEANGTSREGAEKALKKHDKHPDKDIKSFFSEQARRKGVKTFSTHSDTPAEARSVISAFVDGRPFNIVKDRMYVDLQKTGRPEYYIPHPTTMSRDVKTAFVRTRQEIVQLLRNYDGDISFEFDGWTSENHGAYGALCADIIVDGEVQTILIDFIKIAKVDIMIAHLFS
ncbi:hypothetical protein BDZ89DRAFT_968687, partial [Hymenopellis radicata]